MLGVRTLCAFGVAAVLMVSGGAGAVARTCPMLSDPAGDVWDVQPRGPGVQDDQLDIRSADIAGNRTMFAGEIRVYGTQLLQPDPRAPGGRAYMVVADAGQGRASAGPFVGFQIQIDSLGRPKHPKAATYKNPYAGDFSQTAVVDAEYQIDEDQGRIRLWIDYVTFADPDATGVSLRPGRRIRHLWAHAIRMAAVDVTTVGWLVDEADTSLDYRLGDPGCIPVGR